LHCTHFKTATSNILRAGINQLIQVASRPGSTHPNHHAYALILWLQKFLQNGQDGIKLTRLLLTADSFNFLHQVPTKSNIYRTDKFFLSLTNLMRLWLQTMLVPTTHIATTTIALTFSTPPANLHYTVNASKQFRTTEDNTSIAIHFHKILRASPANTLHVFTDGSHLLGKTGAGVVLTSAALPNSICLAIPLGTVSNNFAESLAILCALRYAKRHFPDLPIGLWTDSKTSFNLIYASPTSIRYRNLQHQIRQHVTETTRINVIPSHTTFHLNDLAEALAKTATEQPVHSNITDDSLPYFIPWHF
jgi:ribonuclease HI